MDTNNISDISSQKDFSDPNDGSYFFRNLWYKHPVLAFFPFSLILVLLYLPMSYGTDFSGGFLWNLFGLIFMLMGFVGIYIYLRFKLDKQQK